MGLVSTDGYDRQRAIGETQLRRSTIALIALRSTDWVPEVRQAAVSRLSAAPTVALLPELDPSSRRSINFVLRTAA